MDMDRAPLNRAHQLERKAEVLNRQKKLDECIQCHSEAVELYKKVLQVGDNKSVLESIQMQKEWNERQIRMLQLKKSYLERVEKEKKVEGITSSKHSQKDSAVANLEAKIFRNFETHDSLICYLAQKGIIDTHDKHCHSTIDEKDESHFVVGNKHPKDDSIVIEELKELSGQLRESVQGLLIQLDDRNKEIEQLKTKIKALELEKSGEDLNIIHSEKPKNTLQLLNEVTAPVTKPSLSELGPDSPELPSLPQLETITIPDLDTSAFKQFQMPELRFKLLRKEE